MVQILDIYIDLLYEFLISIRGYEHHVAISINKSHDLKL